MYVITVFVQFTPIGRGNKSILTILSDLSAVDYQLKFSVLNCLIKIENAMVHRDYGSFHSKG